VRPPGTGPASLREASPRSSPRVRPPRWKTRGGSWDARSQTARPRQSAPRCAPPP